jgi:hypothetical protein
MITIREFLALGFRRWIEVHWSLASTEQAAREYLKRRGVEPGTLYRVPFGWLMPMDRNR